ncbi:hypothetical protein [Pseudomonas sp. FYR_11]
MDITIFMTLREFININKELAIKTGLTIYGANSPESLYEPLSAHKQDAWTEASPLGLLIGTPENSEQLHNLPQGKILRDNRQGFVTATFGGEDEFALGGSHFGSDPSPISDKVNKELRKLLKKHSNPGITASNGDILKNHFWTEEALILNKQWHRFLRTGKYQYKNKTPGFKPLLSESKNSNARLPKPK